MARRFSKFVIPSHSERPSDATPLVLSKIRPVNDHDRTDSVNNDKKLLEEVINNVMYCLKRCVSIDCVENFEETYKRGTFSAVCIKIDSSQILARFSTKGFGCKCFPQTCLLRSKSRLHRSS